MASTEFTKQFICAAHEYGTFEHPVPAPYFRRKLILSRKAVRARLYICGLGFYELFVNGKKMTKGRLAPYISNPDDLLYYDFYDLTGCFVSGENVLGVMLGNGMQNAIGGLVWDFDKAPWRSAPKLALELHLEYENGEEETILADEKFRTADSPIRMDDLRSGEWYDAEKEIPEWNLPGFDDSGWKPALPCKAPEGETVLCRAEPITVSRTLKPVSIRRGHISGFANPQFVFPELPLPEDENMTEGWLYDFGVNTAGVCRLKIHGKAGQKVVLQFGELLDETGGLDLRGMKFLPKRYDHRNIYICKGGAQEEYTPSFTYFGFRYCLVMGITPEQASEDLLTYEEMHSDLTKRGSFSCSDPMANAIWEATQISNVSNFYYFPTDCPHREKNGWTGDAALSAEQMLCSLSVENSFREWLRNIRKAQSEAGALPGIVPTGGWGFSGVNGPAWDSVIFCLPYYIYRYREDRTVLEENAGAMLRYLNYLSGKRNEHGTLSFGLGDWCHAGRDAEDPVAPLEVTDTMIGMSICRMAAYCFDVLEQKAQKEFAETLYEELRTAARRRLLDRSSMTVLGTCQTSQAMGLYYDLFEPEERQQAFSVLKKLIAQNNDCLDVGVLGARVLFHVLSDFGETELAYKMITRTDFPSYGYWISQGATALWESFQHPGRLPESKNHHFWGDVASWFVKNLAGIVVNPNGKNASEILLRPNFISALSSAQGSYDTVSGTVFSSWKKKENGDVEWTVSAAPRVFGKMKAPDGYVFENGTNGMPLTQGTFLLHAGGRGRLNSRGEKPAES